jgi:8-oxo-dGTP pyrophosphatase MutT (NUDIX family)
MQHDGGWKRQSSRYLFESRWYNVRQDRVVLPGGEPITYTLVDHPGYAMIVPVLEDGRVILERVFRYALQETVLECPSGGLDGQTPAEAAARELEEETGWIAGRLTSLGTFFGSAGMSNERFHLFLADQLSETGQIAREPTEQIELAIMPLEHAFELVLDGGITEGPTALGIMLARIKLAG